MSEKKPEINESISTDEDKLIHEVAYLQGRIKNLEVFKKMFFTLQEDLVVERRKYTELEAAQDGNTDALHDAPAPPAAPSQLNMEPIQHNAEGDTSALQEKYDSLTQFNELLTEAADEYLDVIDFFRESAAVSSYSDMVEQLFKTISYFNCQVTIEIRSGGSETIFASDESLRERDESAIKRLKIRGRVVEEKGCICINFINISLFISDMPAGDERQYGRIKENILLLASGASDIVGSIESKEKLLSERQNIYKVVKRTHNAMEKIEKGIGNQIRKTNDVQTSFVKEVSIAVENFNISVEEKKKIFSLLAAGKKNLSKVLMESFVLDENFMTVIKRLEKAYAYVESTEKQAAVVKQKKAVLDPFNVSEYN